MTGFGEEGEEEGGHEHASLTARWRKEWQRLKVEPGWKQGGELCGHWDVYPTATLPPNPHQTQVVPCKHSSPQNSTEG